MDNQQRAALDRIGGGPLEGPGFESEATVLQDEITFTTPAEQERSECPGQKKIRYWDKLR